MSNLLKKKQPGKIPRSPAIVPENTFTMKELENNAETNIPKITHKATSSSNVIVEKSTTVRVNVSTKNKINTLVTLGIASTVDDVIDLLINDYLTNILTKDERKQFEIIYELYKNKTK